jgi:hypothetical protein
MTESHEDRSKVTIPDLAGTPAPPPKTAPPPDAPRAVEAGNGMPLFSGDEGGRLRERWDSIQTGFVDEPRHAVEEADGLVAEAMQGLTKQFADERSRLEAQWSRGSDISTEDLRQALRRYRSFFDRLLAA